MKSKKWIILFVILTLLMSISACSKQQTTKKKQTNRTQQTTKKNQNDTPSTKQVANLPQAPKKSIGKRPNHQIYYELFVRSFYDSNGDGIGDLKGATEKLDYLKKLGITGIWLMPIFKSPSYHGYDVTDYKTVNPDYGTNADLKTFVNEAHKRGIKVLLDLVLNHTSNQNPWFKDALSSPTSAHRNWYIWKDKNTKGPNVGEWGQSLWHGSGKNTYFGVYSDSMPDLNYSNPIVQKTMINIGKYWLKTADVDGYRLDGAKFIFNDQNNTINWWYKFDQAMKTVKKNVFLVGEIWDSSYVIAPYYRSLDSAFNFDLSTKIISAVNSGDAKDLVQSLIDTRKSYAKESNHYIDSIFLTNHDMNRIMSQVLNDKHKAKLAAAILFTLPGDPFIYYGEEIGMQGTKPDEHIREPMPWTNDATAKGTTQWEISLVDNPSVASEQKDPHSMLNVYKSLIQERKSSAILMNGDIKTSSIDQYGILAYKRTYNGKSLLIIHNLSDSKTKIKLPKDETSFNHIVFQVNGAASLKSGTVDLSGNSTVILSQK